MYLHEKVLPDLIGFGETLCPRKIIYSIQECSETVDNPWLHVVVILSENKACLEQNDICFKKNILELHVKMEIEARSRW